MAIVVDFSDLKEEALVRALRQITHERLIQQMPRGKRQAARAAQKEAIKDSDDDDSELEARKLADLKEEKRGRSPAPKVTVGDLPGKKMPEVAKADLRLAGKRRRG